MIAKFRDEFEQPIEAARMRSGLGDEAGSDLALAAQGAMLADGQTELGLKGEDDEAPGAHEGAPGTHRGGSS
jgi:hypothetical protein